MLEQAVTLGGVASLELGTTLISRGDRLVGVPNLDNYIELTIKLVKTAIEDGAMTLSHGSNSASWINSTYIDSDSIIVREVDLVVAKKFESIVNSGQLDFMLPEDRARSLNSMSELLDNTESFAGYNEELLNPRRAEYRQIFERLSKSAWGTSQVPGT